MRKLAMVRTARPDSVLFSVRVDPDRVSVRRDLACDNCGYGIHVAMSKLPLRLSCPMCQRFEWRLSAPPPAGRLLAVAEWRQP